MATLHNINRSKFTKGEKCLFAHLVLTFSFTIVFVIIYLVHLYVVNHNLNEVLNTRRHLVTRKDFHTKQLNLENLPIGIMFLNLNPPINVCNILLLNLQWSVAPAHCIVPRYDPDLSHLLSNWTIRYNHNQDKLIQRSIVHPHFDSDTFVNNVGLLEHGSINSLQEYRIVNLKNSNLIRTVKDMYIISWTNDERLNGNITNAFSVDLTKRDICVDVLKLIIELRNYEFCVKPQNKGIIFLAHGAVIISQHRKKIFGFFTWGEKQLSQSLPLVFLNLSHFHEWLHNK